MRGQAGGLAGALDRWPVGQRGAVARRLGLVAPLELVPVRAGRSDPNGAELVPEHSAWCLWSALFGRRSAMPLCHRYRGAVLPPGGEPGSRLRASHLCGRALWQRLRVRLHHGAACQFDC